MNTHEPTLADMEEAALAGWLADQMIEATLGVLEPSRRAALENRLGADWASVKTMHAVGLLPTLTRRAGFVTAPDPSAPDTDQADAEWLADRILEASAGVLEPGIRQMLEGQHGDTWLDAEVAVALGLLPTRTRLGEWFARPDATPAERAALEQERIDARTDGTLPEMITLYMELEQIEY